jgi:hypothetical protein
MRKILLIIGSISFSMGAMAICNDPLRPQELCNEMKHMRSQVLALGAQRDLMQVNYPYFAAIGSEIAGSIETAITHFQGAPDNHLQGLLEIKKVTLDFVNKAKLNDPDTFRLANKIQNQCAACHASENPESGYKWSEIFKLDWAAFYKRCNSEGHNPYYCKNMHGMLSSYSYFPTANNLGRFSYNTTKLAAAEIHRIAGVLKEMGIKHGGDEFLGRLQTKTSEIMSLAEEKNALAFEKGVEIGNTCMSCHGERSRVVLPFQVSSLK